MLLQAQVTFVAGNHRILSILMIDYNTTCFCNTYLNSIKLSIIPIPLEALPFEASDSTI